ncbi:pyruvate formate lyase-activating protein [Acetivibrio ethanolgignens]|uniref:Pyruvate formate lyase-activating protein n=1 Tax=Acetivibrio ethanolgignens TaxID=290052 RepID=A0A0V8QAI2_9FIRM|nr:glycyl-radical enzyme activating protein [Acetivibrio ethanolgignens]KSV57508.1 pyruvate formate lyase-activating protein [Acetivibrio ethanolgignens]
METGIIFNIQKFSLHDGPGIRTVVFFKGCPLKCSWCANPESQNSKIQILWDREKCTGCQVCIANCPFGAITGKEKNILINHAMCKQCQSCVSGCPAQALKAEGEIRSISEILKVCLQDEDFYKESGGGVTLSGGEPLMHPDFAISLLKALKEHQIHTAIETTGYAAPEIFDRVTEKADLLLFDMKHWKEEKHLEGTGVSNRPILENMKRAIASGKKVLPRLPVIPEYNNSLEDAKGFSERLKEVDAKEIQLLPFHQFGERKYDMLNREYKYTDFPALHEKDLEAFRQIFLQAGIHAFF